MVLVRVSLGSMAIKFWASDVDRNGAALAEIVAMPFAPLAVTLGKGSEAHTSHAVHMPKGCGEVHLLLTTILTDGAVKQGVDAG